MSNLEMLNFFITSLPVFLCTGFIILSLLRYRKSKEKYWLFASIDFMLYLISNIFQRLNNSIIFMTSSVVLIFLFYILMFITLRLESSKNIISNLLKQDKKIYLIVLYFLMIWILAFAIYSYIIFNTIGLIPIPSINLKLLLTFAYPFFDLSFLAYYIMSDNILSINHRRAIRIFFTLSFLFLLIGDIIYVFETAFNIQVYLVDNLVTVISTIILSFALIYIKNNKGSFNYSTLNLISQDNERVFDYDIITIGILNIYLFVYVLTLTNKYININSKVIIYNLGILLLTLILLNYFLIMQYKKQLITKLENESIKDFLTGAFSKKHALNTLEYMFIYSKSHKLPLSVLMLDIDHFKFYNDKWGHLNGDKILKELTSIISKEIGKNNMICRYGGEEFLILLPNISAKKGFNISENIRSKIEETKFLGMETQPLGKLTVSIGGFSMNEEISDIYTLVAKADNALYKAKTTRNTCRWNNFRT